jgi:hypothetical protein
MTFAIPLRPRFRDRLKSILPRGSRPVSPRNPVAHDSSSHPAQPSSEAATRTSGSLQISQQSNPVASASSSSLQTSTQVNSVASTLNPTADPVPSPSATSSVLIPTSLTPSSATSSFRVTSTSSSTNAAFLAALQKHIDKLPEAERQAFRQANTAISPESLLGRVRALDTQHTSTSSFRPHAEKISKFLSVLDRLLGGVAIAIQANPDVSSIAVGGVKLIVDIAMGFTKFFGKLADMFDQLSDIIAPLERYAERLELSTVRDALVNVYGDVLDFYRASSALFIDRAGRSKVHATFSMFLNSQWTPFETEFGEIDSRMNHHRRVLLEAAQAELLSAEGERKQREERKHVENKQQEERKRSRVITLLLQTDLVQFRKGKVFYDGCHHTPFDKSRIIPSKANIKAQVTGCCRPGSSRNGWKRNRPSCCGAMASVSVFV